MRQLVIREAPEDEIAPPELDGMTLVVPRAYVLSYREGYERKTVAALTRLIRPGHVCADLGANVGFFSFFMALRTGAGGRVVAFEPREDMVSYLERSLARNAARVQIEVRQAAVTDGAADTVALHSGDWGTEVRSTILPDLAEREDANTRRVMKVPAVALDDAFPPGDPLDVVKMDIEGAESVALAGAQRILAEQRPAFVVEFHRDVGWPVIAGFAAADYRFEKFDGTRIGTPTEPDEVPSRFVALPR